MRYNILGDSDCPLVNIELFKGEKVKIESGAMAYMSNVTLNGKMNSSRSGLMGFISAIGRSMVSGENIFITEAIGLNDDGIIGIAPSIPGKSKAENEPM